MITRNDPERISESSIEFRIAEESALSVVSLWF